MKNFRLKLESTNQLIYLPTVEKAFFADDKGEYIGDADTNTWKYFIKIKGTEIAFYQNLDGLRLPEYRHIKEWQQATNEDGNILFEYGRRRFKVDRPITLRSKDERKNKLVTLAIKVGIRLYILEGQTYEVSKSIHGDYFITSYEWDEI